MTTAADRPDDGRRRVHREVVSFVRRSARMNPSQQQAWQRHHDAWVVEIPRGETSTSVGAEATTLDLPALFGRAAPLVVEIGSGVGDSPVAVAAAHPRWDVLAFEVFEPALASTLVKINKARVGNVRLVMADGAQALHRLLPPASISELRVFFPDPWHKARHHKRRLVSAEFADVVATRLVPGGRWLLATDWPDYAAHMREVLDAHPRFVNPYDGPAPRADRPLTKYEARGIAAGRPIVDLCYQLRPAPPVAPGGEA